MERLRVPPGRSNETMDYVIISPCLKLVSATRDAERFGAILARIRIERGWTRQKLATRSGMSPQYVAIVEQGGNVPSLTTVLELTEVLGADVAEIMRELAAARTAPVKR